MTQILPSLLLSFIVLTLAPVALAGEDPDCSRVQASADCGRESKQLRQACDDDLGSAVRTNQLVSSQFAPNPGDGPEAIGKRQAGVLRAHRTNWESAKAACESRQRDLSNACACAHRKANERYEEAKRMADRTKHDPRISQKYKDEADKEWRSMSAARQNFDEANKSIKDNQRKLASEVGKGGVGTAAGTAISSAAGSR